jgi:hypothetical protein
VRPFRPGRGIGLLHERSPSRCFFRPAASSAEDLDLTGIFSNYGPVNTRFESAFGGGGRGSGGTWVALPRWPYPGRPRGVGAITENLIGVPAVHLLAASGGRISSINRSFARLNGLTNLTLCKMNLRERQPPLGVRQTKASTGAEDGHAEP